MKKRMKSRWNLHCQREGGTIPMWQVLSFSGKFDPNFFDNLEDPGPPPDEAIRDQRHWTSRASKTRKRWRQGMNAASQGRAILTRKQQHLVELYENGELLEEANQLTLRSGNGTLHRIDGEKFMIGPHGFTKRVLYKPDEREVEKFFAMSGT